MNNDTKNIFEAYVTHKKMLNEAPPAYAMGDLNIPDEKIKSAPGKGYGLGKTATKTGRSMEDVTNELVKKIQNQLFRPENHIVDGIEYKLFYPSNDMRLKNDLTNLVQKELGLGKTEAGYTARIVRNMLNIIVKDEATGATVAKPERIKAAVIAAKDGAAAEKPVKTETVYEIDKTVKLPEKSLRKLVLSLPDEDVHEKEVLSVLKNAIKEYNETPGLDKKDTIKAKSYDLLDTLKANGILKEKQVEKEVPEGEGSGEVETVEDYPEGDDVYSTAKQEFGLRSAPGDRNYGDFS
jgi:hypothetical protein